MLTHLAPQPTLPDRVVVVGARGFVGAAIAARLERGGVAVLRIGREDVDLLSPGAGDRLAARLRPNDVLVAAAALAPCKSYRMLVDNVRLAAAIVEAATRVGLAQVVNVSSDAVYSDSAEPLDESSTTAPDSLHGVMHFAREAMFRSSIDVPLVMLRPTLIYGAEDPHNGYGPNRFRRLALAGEPIVLFGKGEERRDHVCIDDVAELSARVILRRSRGVLNLVSGATASFRDVAEAVVRLSGKSLRIDEVPRAGPMPHNGYRPFDVSACRAAFPDFIQTPLEVGLAKALAQEISQGKFSG